MTTNVHAIEPEAPIEQAKERLKKLGCRHLVVMRGSTIIGVLSDRDVHRGRLQMQDDPWLVRDVMTSHVVVAAPETTVHQAALLMRGHAIGCLPVVDGKRLVGIVTTSDLLEMIASGAHTRAEQPAPPPVDPGVART